jgi:hypothetical protein
VIFTNTHRRVAREVFHSRPDDDERDEVIRRFQALVDGGSASWWIDDTGSLELHLANGNAFLLQGDGVLRLR